MKLGMLWFDNDPKADLQTKVKRAADYYLSKYGKIATICYVHPDMIPAGTDGEINVQAAPDRTIEVRPTRTILRNHLWIGTVDKIIDQGL